MKFLRQITLPPAQRLLKSFLTRNELVDSVFALFLRVRAIPARSMWKAGEAVSFPGRLQLCGRQARHAPVRAKRQGRRLPGVEVIKFFEGLNKLLPRYLPARFLQAINEQFRCG